MEKEQFATVSKSGQLIKQDWSKIFKGLGIALGGSALAYFSSEIIPMLQGLDLTGSQAILVALASTLVNALMKWVSESRYD